MALVPDAVFYFAVSPETLSERTLMSRRSLDYWESGMDLGLSRDWFTSFQKYQALMRTEFEALREQHKFNVIDANGSLVDVQYRLRDAVDRVLAASYKAPAEQPAPKVPSPSKLWMNLEVS
jgi:dTMP kinase